MKFTITLVCGTVRGDTTNVGSCRLIFVSSSKYVFNMAAVTCGYLFLSNWTLWVFEECMGVHAQ